MHYSGMHKSEKATENQDAELLNPNVMICVKRRGMQGGCGHLPTTQDLSNVLGNQANVMANSHSNVQVKQELESENEDDRPAPLSFCSDSPNTAQRAKTDQSQGCHHKVAYQKKNVERLCEVLVKRKQDGGLSQPKGLLTPAVDDRLENIATENVMGADNTIEPVNVREEIDEYYTYNNVYQPANICDGNTENETSDIMTSVHLEGNVETVVDSEGRSGMMERRNFKEESEELNMTVEEEDIVNWNRENSSSEVTETDEHAYNLFGREDKDSKWMSAESSHRKPKKKGKLHCAVCGYSTNNKSYLIIHIRTHSQQKAFACELCGYSTKHKSHLTSHMRTHTEEKLIRCGVCNYSTNHKSYLTSHMRTHMQGKSYVCDICSYSTNHKSHLTSHMRTHTQEKSYVCGVCVYSTNHKSRFTAHMSAHNKNGL